MGNKYDKALSNLLAKFYTNSKVDESVRRIVQSVINAEMNKLDFVRPHGVIEEIISSIEDEAEQIANKHKKK